MAIDVAAELFAVFGSLEAPVVPLTGLVPDVVGVPVTVQTMLAPAATVAGGVGVHDVLNPAGSPLTEQAADVALIEALDEFVQVKLPL